MDITVMWFGIPLEVTYGYTPEEPQTWNHEGWPEEFEITKAITPDGSNLLDEFEHIPMYLSIEAATKATLKGE